MEKATVKLKKMWCFEEYRDVGGGLVAKICLRRKKRP